MPAYAAALILLLLVQAGLGGVTVLDQNSPWSVALHLSTALLLFSVLWLILARTGPVVASDRRRAAGPLSVAVWLLALGAMASAAMTTKSGAALACSTWPLCDGALIPDLADPAIRLNFTPSPARVRRRLGRARPLHRVPAPTRARAARRSLIVLLILARDRARRPRGAVARFRSATALAASGAGRGRLRRHLAAHVARATRRPPIQGRFMSDSLSRA